MKKETNTKKKVQTNVFFPPFLENFNVKKIVTKGEKKEPILLLSPALKMVKKISFKSETTSETIIRLVENYLLLIITVKTYHMLFTDAVKERSFHRIEKLKPKFIRRYAGMNEPFVNELEKVIDLELKIAKWGHYKYPVRGTESDMPYVSNENILPTLENVSFKDTIQKLVDTGVFPPQFVKKLSPRTEHGLLALTVYKATMQLVETELRKMIEEERLKIPPQSLDEFFSRLLKIGAT